MDIQPQPTSCETVTSPRGTPLDPAAAEPSHIHIPRPSRVRPPADDGELLPVASLDAAA